MAPHEKRESHPERRAARQRPERVVALLQGQEARVERQGRGPRAPRRRVPDLLRPEGHPRDFFARDPSAGVITRYWEKELNKAELVDLLNLKQ